MLKRRPLPAAASLAKADNLEALLAQAEAELSELEPQLEKLQAEVDRRLERLSELRASRQKLLSLKLSLQAILNRFEGPAALPELLNGVADACAASIPMPATEPNLPAGRFDAELALAAADRLLKQKPSLNHALFEAVVAQGGVATTAQIKAFLVEHDIRQPGRGESFAAIPLTDISARMGYLIRRGLLRGLGRGRFAANTGWQPEDG